MSARKPIQVTYELTYEPEQRSPAEDFDQEAVAWVREQLRAGNEWAWCVVCVTARVELDGQSFMGTDYLGGCSYESESAFREGGYYDDMKASALADLRNYLTTETARGKVAARVLKGLERLARTWGAL